MIKYPNKYHSLAMMNPPPEPQIQPNRPSISSTTCDLHPEEQFTGFCPLCLYHRLSTLDTTNVNSTKSTTTTSTSAAIKNLFKPSASFPELRRTKSLSVSNKDATHFSGPFEPQRKSCDVRLRNNNSSNNNPLWCLFNHPANETRKSSVVDEVQAVQDSNLPCCSTSSATTACAATCVIESKGDKCDEIIFSDELVRNAEDEKPFVEEEKLVKTIKDHINLDLHKKRNPSMDLKEIAGNFMSAATTGISKKLQKWRHKQKPKKDRKTLPIDKSIGRQYRETQSEIADYGNGRRSCDTLDAGRKSFCDTEPRFSLDVGRKSFCDTEPRFSLDVGRMSFDEPRVSWDGHSMGKTVTRMAPMVPMAEHDTDHVHVHVPRTDSEIPVEQTLGLMDSDNDGVPGGSAQTRNYYLDSSSKRRKSVDRSSSLRRMTMAAQGDEMTKPVSYARVSPDDCLETFKMGFRDNASIMGGEGENREPGKKSSRWSKVFNIWGLIQRRGGLKDGDGNKISSINGVELRRSFSHSSQIEHNGDPRGDLNRNILRSNSSVSWRNSNGFEAPTSFRSCSVRKNNTVTSVHDKKMKDEFVMERNRSLRYSPNYQVNNGLLRFYLNPLVGNLRSTSMGKKQVT